MTRFAQTRISQIGLALVLGAAVALAPLPIRASEGGNLLHSGANIEDQASLQRGAKYFSNYCLSCHSLKYMRWSRLASDLGLSEQQVMGSLNFAGTKFGEPITTALVPADGDRWFGKAPPDLSLIARARPGGADYIYTYLKSFYLDAKRPLGWNNTVFPAASMPNVLWELQGSQAAIYDRHKVKDESGQEIEKEVFSHFEQVKPGKMQPEEFDGVARDLSAFLEYVGEPAALQRRDVGWKVILFLALFTFVAWLLKVEYWRDVH